MADSAPADETPNQRQARLRRERRNAKLQAEGADRLNKITSLSGRPAPADESSPSPAASAKTTAIPTSSQSTPSRAASTPISQPQHPTVADDPDIDDIDNAAPLHPRSAAPFPSQQDLLRQMLRAPPPGANGPQGNVPENDPMLQMMQQMMGGAGGAGANGTVAGGLPPGLADLLGGQSAEEQPASSADYVWRIVHAVFAFLLAFYAITTFAFSGISFSRSRNVSDWNHVAAQDKVMTQRLFWIFTTVELLLQSTRYFADGGKLPRSGWLAIIGRFLPEPYAGYVRIASRYSIIYTTVVSDAMVIVFVLGAAAWWKGQAA